MNETKLAVNSSIFTVLTLSLCEGILSHYLPKDEYGSYFYLRINLFTVLGLLLACNYTFTSAAFRNQPAVLRKGALKKSVLYSFLILTVITMQLVLLYRQVETGQL